MPRPPGRPNLLNKQELEEWLAKNDERLAELENQFYELLSQHEDALANLKEQRAEFYRLYALGEATARVLLGRENKS